MAEKSYAKVIIFLKIAYSRDNYHERVSSFVRVHSRYDKISFIRSKRKAFEIIGNFGWKMETNTNFKAYEVIKS
ncbi:4-(cytidine 5'-diphospho)-2-C-methyl-D-erythritol kinase, partial [Aliarcobacter butzleri]